jgi:integrase
MKNPGEKIGNNVWCYLPPEALQIILSMPKRFEEIFPYSGDAIGTNFTRACQFLEIIDLHLHDLRHDGVSRLFEIGRNIPQVAAVSGHRSWSSLKRYTHLRQTGDKYAGWKWLSALTSHNLTSMTSSCRAATSRQGHEPAEPGARIARALRRRSGPMSTSR